MSRSWEALQGFHWYPSKVRMPYTSKLEHRLSLYLDYHPHVRTYQRGDATNWTDRDIWDSSTGVFLEKMGWPDRRGTRGGDPHGFV